jgi:tartronate-semialdehyde synthase
VCITGQADSRKLHNEAFQTVGIVEIAKPVTKLAVQVKEAAQLPWIFREAFGSRDPAGRARCSSTC